MDIFFFQAEGGIGVLVRSRGLGDVYKRQGPVRTPRIGAPDDRHGQQRQVFPAAVAGPFPHRACLLYTSDAADERSSVDLGGRRILKKKKQQNNALNRTPATT
mgnify:CR=1 FL=1